MDAIDFYIRPPDVVGKIRIPLHKRVSVDLKQLQGENNAKTSKETIR